MKRIILLAILCASLGYVYAGTRVETEDVVFQGFVDAQRFEDDYLDFNLSSRIHFMEVLEMLDGGVDL